MIIYDENKMSCEAIIKAELLSKASIFTPVAGASKGTLNCMIKEKVSNRHCQ